MHQISQPNFGILEISGVDAAQFLQGQLTCDIKKITDDHSMFGAHCNLQGRVIFLAKVMLNQDNFYLLMPKAMIADAINELKKFVLRSKVIFRDISDEVTMEPYLKNLPANIAWIIPETSQKYLPHDLNYHNLGAISFDKGCYIGQEIIARMHYRAELKKQLTLIEVNHEELLNINYNDILIAIAEDKTESKFEIVNFEVVDNKLFLLGVLYKKDLLPKFLKFNDELIACHLM